MRGAAAFWCAQGHVHVHVTGAGAGARLRQVACKGTQARKRAGALRWLQRSARKSIGCRQRRGHAAHLKDASEDDRLEHGQRLGAHGRGVRVGDVVGANAEGHEEA
jgi:hypothetical protein